MHIEQPYVLDERFAAASGMVIATVEEIVSTEEVMAAGVVVPGYQVTAVVEAAYGAHPTSCYPRYAYDRSHMADYVRAMADTAGTRRYLEEWVLLEDGEEAYRARIGEDRLGELTSWSTSNDAWMELFA